MPEPVRDLTARVHEFFVENGRAFGLDPATLDVTYVLNWGGFVNYSFRVREARTRFHLKLAVTEAAKDSLRRWQKLDPLLRPYNAPHVIDSVEFGGVFGLLFPVVEGSTPRLTSDVMTAVLNRLRALWDDREIASRLASGSIRTAADCYRDTYHDRFTEDLRIIEVDLPPFVSPRDLQFMQEQARDLTELVESHAVFQREVTSPIHGDLWLNNILWKDVESWHILDRDDVQIGDPAMDLAMLTGPSAVDLAPLRRVDQLRGTVPEDVMERVIFLGRAALLDWVIDPLADWLDAGIAPGTVEIRREKQKVHAAALELYRRLYPDA